MRMKTGRGAATLAGWLTAAWMTTACSGCVESPDERRNSQRLAKRDSPSGQMEAGDLQDLSASDRYLIIHADDAGMCRSVNRATIAALEGGAVTSASMMVPCPAFEEFADYACNHPEFDYGIHLTLNSEFPQYRWGPVMPPDEVPSLIDKGGNLWPSEAETAAHARADDVERELRAQIDKALEADVPLSHLDTHMGAVFVREDFLDIYLRLGTDYQLPVLLTRDDEFGRQLGFDDRIITQAQQAAARMESLGYPVLDKIMMHYTTDSLSQKKRAYREMISRAPLGVSEIIVHCGYADDELRSITLRSLIRDGDRQVFTDPKFIDELQRSGVHLISWKELMRLTQRSQDSE